jgi:type IV secretion system protein TrbE
MGSPGTLGEGSPVTFAHQPRVYEDVRSTMELIPWLEEITPGVVLQKDDSLLVVFRYEALDIEGKTWDEIEHNAAQWEQAARLADETITVQMSVRRRAMDAALPATFADPMAGQVDAWWQAQCSTGALFVNEHTICFHRASLMGESLASALRFRLGEGASLGQAVRFAVGNALRPETYAALHRQRLLDEAGKLQSVARTILGAIGRLAATQLTGEALWAYLKAGVSPASTPAQVKAMGDMDIVTGTDFIESVGPRTWRFDGSGGTRYCTLMTLQSWPSPYTWPTLLEPLLSIPGTFHLQQTFRYASSAAARRAIRAARRYNESRIKSPVRLLADKVFGNSDNTSGTDPGRIHNVEETLAAEESLTAERRVFGYANVSLAVFGATIQAMEEAARALVDTIQSAGFGVVRETVGSLTAFRGTLPGSSRDIVSWQQIHTGNFIDAAPIRTEDCGSPTVAWWSDQMQKPVPAVAILPTHRRTAMLYSPLVGSLGHFFVIGPPGNGKTTLTNFLSSQLGRVGARICHIDKDHSTRVTTLTHGGQYVDFMAGDVQFNPFVMLHDTRHATFLAQFLQSLICAHGYVWSSSDSERVHQAILAMADLDPSWHHLEALAPTLGSQTLLDQLEPWLPGGAYGRYFGGRVDTLKLTSHFGIELGKVLDDPVVAPRVLHVLFHRLRDWLDRTDERVPTLVDVQEARYFVQDPYFRAILVDFLTTIRRKMGMVALSTQSVQHLQDPAIWASIADTVMTRWFTANPQVMSEEWQGIYRDTLGLSGAQIEAIGSAVPMRDYVLWRPQLTRTINLGLSAPIMATLRGDKRALAALDRHYPADSVARQGMAWRHAYIADVTQ